MELFFNFFETFLFQKSSKIVQKEFHCQLILQMVVPHGLSFATVDFQSEPLELLSQINIRRKYCVDLSGQFPTSFCFQFSHSFSAELFFNFVATFLFQKSSKIVQKKFHCQFILQMIVPHGLSFATVDFQSAFWICESTPKTVCREA